MGVLASCTAPPASRGDDAQLGTLTLNLVAQAPSGKIYRLRDAVIEIDGPAGSRVWNTDDDPTRSVLSDDVAPGDYTAGVHDGWRLERLDGSVATPVTGSLVSDNPVHFVVAPGARTSVPLHFVVSGDDVDLTQGYDITITIDEAPRRLVVSQYGFSGLGIPPALEVFSNSASGDVPPLQQITGPHTGLTAPRSVTNVGDELLVCDEANHTLAFYASTAHGDEAPVRWIKGSNTQLWSPTNAVVYKDEIYTLQADGQVLVFPVGASGNVAPSRSFLTDGASFMAVAHDEIYLRSQSDDGQSTARVQVYPVTATGSPRPSRTILGDTPACPGTIIAHNQELYVADWCGAIYVFPQNANGQMHPLRTITGHTTGFDMVQQIWISGSELYAVDQATNRVSVFPVQTDGDVAPTRVIEGPHTDIAQPLGIAVF